MISSATIASDRFDEGESCINDYPQKPLILVIEDDPDNLLLLYHFLTLNQFDVLLASDALTGLTLATAHSPDLVLLDIQMPKMSGYDLIRRMGKNLELKHIPIIAVTGMAQDKDKQRILQWGCADYICKPYLLEYLLEVIQRQLDKLKPFSVSA